MTRACRLDKLKQSTRTFQPLWQRLHLKGLLLHVPERINALINTLVRELRPMSHEIAAHDIDVRRTSPAFFNL